MIDSTRGPLLLVALLAGCGGANAPGDLAANASGDMASSPSDDLASSAAPDLAGGGGGDLATATGGCTMPTSGYYVIGAASSTGPGVKLYLVGKGADGWDKELGDILLNGQPVGLDYLTGGSAGHYATSGPKLYGVDVATRTATLAADLTGSAGINTFYAVGQQSANQFVATRAAEVYCVDYAAKISTDVGSIPSPPGMAYGVSGTCVANPAAFQIHGVGSDGVSTYFFDLSLASGSSTPVLTSLSNQLIDSGAHPLGLAENGSVTLTSDGYLVGLSGNTPTKIRRTRLCYDSNPNNPFNGSLIPNALAISD